MLSRPACDRISFRYSAFERKLMRREKKVIYYSDELRDEFAGVSRSGYEVPKKYKYIHKNIFWRALAFFVYRVIMTPISLLQDKTEAENRRQDEKETQGRRRLLSLCKSYSPRRRRIYSVASDVSEKDVCRCQPRKPFNVRDEKFSLNERRTPDTEVAVCFQKIYGRN